MRKLLSFLASLKLGLVLLGLLFVLTFAGTLYQVDHGIYNAQKTFFFSWIILDFFVPLPGGQLVLWLLGINLLAALFLRIVNKRPFLGLLIIHAGLVLLLIGGFQGLYLSDSYILGIWEGSSSNKVFAPRSFQFAYTIKNGNDVSEQTIPFKDLKAGYAVDDPVLEKAGITIYFKAIHQNSQSSAPEEGTQFLTSVPADPSAENNHPGLDVLLQTPNGGVLPVAMHSSDAYAKTLTVGDAKLTMTFGPETMDLPFTLTLVHFNAQFYPGTNLPKSFSSEVRITDENASWERTISMNNPLRYKGFTVYQSFYKQTKDGPSASIFAVTRSFFSWIPYAAVILIVIGMIAHYAIRKPAANWKQKKLAFLAVMIIAALGPGYSEGRDLPDFSAAARQFATLRISVNGRVMPVDSFARSSLKSISGKTGLPGVEPAEWFFDEIFLPEVMKDIPLYLIEHPDNLAALELPFSERGRYSYKQIADAIPRLFEIAAPWADQPPKDPVLRDLYNLHRKVDFTLSLADIGKLSPDTESRRVAFFRIVPGKKDNQEFWYYPGEKPDAGDGYAQAISGIAAAVRAGDAKAAEAKIAELLNRQKVEVAGFSSPGSPRLEVLYNRLPLLMLSTLAILLALVITALSRSKFLQSVPWGLALVAATLEAANIIFRMIIMRRPPITSLYSSMLFVACTALVLAVITSRRGERKDLLSSGLILSLLLIILASGFSGSEDTMAVLQAVLDTNFWLTIHVITISLGYTLNLMAGVVAHLYLAAKLRSPYLGERQHKLLRWVYVLLASGLVFSFAGTMLGGFWADQSWGRFWGWDPKENGALMIILWGAVLLHARPSGWFKDVGFANGAIFGVPVVLFSWLGVNMLGVGLHSYGFASGSLFVLLGFAAAEVVFALTAWLIIRKRGDMLLPEARNFVIVEKQRESRNCFSFLLEPQYADERSLKIVHAAAGSFVTVAFQADGRILKRAYSLSDWSAGAKAVRLTIKNHGAGSGSAFLVDNYSTGQTLQLMGPSGDFALTPKPGGPEIFLASGTGFAPILAMLKQRLILQKDAEATLYLGVKNAGELIHADELQSLITTYSGFRCNIYLSEQTNSAVPSIAGAHLLSSHFTLSQIAADQPATRAIYACGSDAFVDALEEERKALAGTFKNAVWAAERFTPMPSARRMPAKAYQVTFVKEGKAVAVQPGQSILQAALDHGVRMNYSCGIGRCRDCLCTVREGAALMDEPNTLAEPEITAGRRILACIAYPAEDLKIETD